MNRYAKAASTITAARTGTTRARRTVFGMACLCVLGLVAFAGIGSPSAGADTACPNEAIRATQHADQLADCRAWEMVTPLSKGNGDIVADGLTTIASKNGNAVAFNSRTPFGDTVGSGVSGQTQYVASRGVDGWSSHSVTPTPRPDAYQTFFAPTRLQNFSDDLSTAVVTAYDLPGSTNDTPLRNNIYIEDTASRGLVPATVSQKGELTIFDFLDPGIWGISADAHHLAFVSQTQMLPDNIAPGYPNGAPNVYQSDDGVLSLAGILPQGEVPPGGSNVIPNTYRAAMSADGSRQLFTASPTFGALPQIYQRIDGNRTVWISEPEGSDKSEPTNVQLQAATRDGRNVFFVTDSPVLDADTNAGPDLYRYTDSPDPEHEDNLTLLSDAGNVAGDLNGSSAVIGVSDDGERVYYQTSASAIMVWDHGTTRTATEGIGPDGAVANGLGATASKPGLGRVSPDGAYLAFLTASDPMGLGVGGHYEMYTYSLATESLSCVSCPQGPPIGNATIQPAATSGLPTLEDLGIRPSFLADDGRTFFSTPEALVSRDVNGVLDAYEYDPATGELGLLSSGRGSAPATFADASASGNDVFITTRQQLVGADTDELVDLYDVRTGGGFPEPAASPSPCSGEGCQVSSPGAPAAPAVASTAATRGNLKQRRHHKRCTPARRRAGKCAKHKHRHHRTATTNRRTEK